MKIASQRRRVRLVLVVALLGSCIATGAAMAAPTIAYLPKSYAYSYAMLVEHLPGDRARVVISQGYAEGTRSGTDQNQKIVLDAPISYRTFASVADSCGDYPPVRLSLKRMELLRKPGDPPEQGTTQVVESGTETYLDGCDVGQTVKYNPEGVSIPTRHLDLALRAPVIDLVPGKLLAGMTQHSRDLGLVAEDQVRFLAAERVKFLSTDAVFDARFNAEGWLVLKLPTLRRGYMRLTIDAQTGAEGWLEAELVDGKPVNVLNRLFVSPVAGASFGTARQAARMWQSYLFVNTPQPFFVYQYRGGEGERIAKDRRGNIRQRWPIDWRFDAVDIVQEREESDVSYSRRWVPIANNGTARWVMESEDYWDGANWVTWFPPRVNAYIDTGKAIPPASVVRLPQRSGDAPALQRGLMRR